MAKVVTHARTSAHSNKQRAQHARTHASERARHSPHAMWLRIRPIPVPAHPAHMELLLTHGES
eukprot:CAMPEP_0119362042 /NCGR_PEP_ID=MMETSP1334-20130426/9223_1 /TAXON_ID=127549 /ORGANISM="Calcidiscus leptoporus, Strain RCC1130" /LENGTH=62 /DNA_ID=CAMNT_0007377201 /DNA_START=46 /DNA_END=231 /DNA_ORIENTATION=-